MRTTVLPASSALQGTTFRAAALALCGLAFLLRWFHLGAQSLWYDEALSVSLAIAPLRSMVAQLIAQDVHPPLYFALLHFWILGAGSGEVAVRALSAWWGVLGVALLITLGARLGGRTIGLVAGALAGASPLLVYYGQETRMYAMLAGLGTLAAYAFVRATGGRRRWWLVAAIVLAAALWTHLAAGALVVALNVGYLWERLRQHRPRRWDGAWFLAQVAVLLLFAPWLWVAEGSLRDYASPVHGGPVGWMLEQTAIVFGLGHTVVGLAVSPGTANFAAQDALARLLLLPFLPACILGFVALRRHRLLLLTWLILPAAAIIALAAHVHGFDPRYLIGSAPAYLLLLAAGLVWCWQQTRRHFLGFMLAAAVAGASGFALINVYNDPVYARDDNRGVVQYLARQATAGAGVVLDANFQPAFDYYAHDRFPTLNVPATTPADPVVVSQALTAFAAQHGQLWLVLWHDYYADPQRLIWGWLLKQRYAADWININDDFKVLQFDQAPSDLLLSGAAFGGLTTLVGSTVQVQRDGLQVDLYWRTTGRFSANDHIALHLLDSAGNVYAEADTLPANGRLPTTSWAPGDQYHTTADLPLAPWTARGPYRLQVQFYDPNAGADLPTTGPQAVGTSVMIPLVLPAPAPTALPELTIPLDATFAGVGTLAGYTLTPDSGVERTLTLFWRAAGPTAIGYTVFVHALAPDGRVLADADSVPVSGSSPTTRWMAGELIRDPHRLTLPTTTSSAGYEVGLYSAATGARVIIHTGTGATPTDRALRLAA
ncbi:MAG: glycosyltransferase family 39 protein [Chloroflexota bacterium]